MKSNGGEEGSETDDKSLPARGAWIEITIILDTLTIAKVAPRTGSVD